MFPVGVAIDPNNGAVEPSTGRYTKRLSELRGLYRDQPAFDAKLAKHGDVIAYEVVEFRQPGSDLFFGTTTMYPGQVGQEYFMTRGHFHERRDRLFERFDVLQALGQVVERLQRLLDARVGRRLVGGHWLLDTTLR